MTEQNFTPEKKESFEQLELGIQEPHPGLHTWEIYFEANTKLYCMAYNTAINSVCKEEKLGPFHQNGIQNEPGYHAWEMFGGETNKVYLASLLPEIQKRARENYIKYKDMGF